VALIRRSRDRGHGRFVESGGSGAPLDGGRVLRAVLWRHCGDRDRAATSAARSGRYLGVLLAVLGIAEFLLTGDFLGGLWLMLIGWFLTSAASALSLSTRSPLGGEATADMHQAELMPAASGERKGRRVS